MSALVVADPVAAALAGAPDPGGPPDVVVALDDTAVPAGVTAPVVRWWRGAAPGPREGERVIGTAGDGLWSRAPWPVRDEVFALAPPTAPGRVLLVGASDDELAFARARGLTTDAVERLTLDALAAADVVMHGIGLGAPLPGDALAVLAAGRLLVTNAVPGFGLRPGIDHLAAEGISPACDIVEAALAAPGAFAALRRAGRLAAGRFRASDVYARLAFDVTA